MKKNDIFEIILITAFLIYIVYFKVELSNVLLIIWASAILLITLCKAIIKYFRERRRIKKYYSEYIDKIKFYTGSDGKNSTLKPLPNEK